MTEKLEAPHVLVSEKLSPAGIEILEKAGVTVDVKLGLSAAELEAIIGDYDGLIVRSATKVNRSLIEKATRMRVIGRTGTGVDNIDLQASTENGIVVCNTPDANTMAAAEFAVALAMAICRNIPQADRRFHQDDFRKNLLVGIELEGKTAGVIGLGRIGAIVARKLAGLGMDVVAYDQYVNQERFDRLGIRRAASIDELLQQVDLLTLHTPKTKETQNLIGARELALMKPGARLVNASRGGIVDEDALYDALASGHLAAAALDVLAVEPNTTAAPGTQNFHHRLMELDNVLLTPHLGASSKEAGEAVSTQIAEQIARVLNGELVPAVNLPPVAGSLDEMAPWIGLAEKLGSIWFQTEHQPVNLIRIRYSGRVLADEHGLVTLSVLTGFLRPISEHRINFVNVRQNIREMGIDVIEEVEDLQTGEVRDGRFPDLLTVSFERDGRALEVSGTVIGGGREVLVDFFGYPVDYTFTPVMLALHNDDVPGVIGRVGSLIGERGINIDDMRWARKSLRSHAEALISIDQMPDEALLEDLRALSGVNRVSLLDFRG
ncbi:MAG: phosphoglycerate dehydrogenase [Bacillota bacterium]|nr:phosphoglycerate dehydrogenase [Bacillota bacterium]